MDNCPEYKNIMDCLWGGEVGIEYVKSHFEMPFLPVTLFKTMDLCSVPKEKIVKTMTSSGTTGQQRMPMLIIDTPSVIKNRAIFSARGAGILGFSIFGTKKLYALDDDMNLQMEEIRAFLEEHKGKTIQVFGFTYMIWQHFYKELLTSGGVLNLSDAVLIHGGGWKKLAGESVSKQEVKNALNKICGIKRVHDYYGMVEQTRCIYMECECGNLHASIFSDVITRRMKDFLFVMLWKRGYCKWSRRCLNLIQGMYFQHKPLIF